MADTGWIIKAGPVRPLMPTRGALILCFFTGSQPANAAAMPRIPSPGVGMTFDSSFERVYRDAVTLNPAVHDGAIMIGWDKESASYRIRGWSFRLFSASIGNAVANKGSAWNSCLAMSMDDDVEALVLASGVELVGLIKGASVSL